MRASKPHSPTRAIAPVGESTPTMKWTAANIARSIGLFVLAGVGEIAGSYLVWKTFKLKQHWAYAALGVAVLFAYAMTFIGQPMDDFGRLLAVYGGFFIAMSYVFGYVVDGFKPDVGDVVGASVALAGVLIIMLYPRAT